MNMEKHLKELLTYYLKQKLNKLQQQIEPVENPPPDLKILTYGMTLGYMDIITEKEIMPEKINKWKEIISEGNKLIILIPKEEKLKITELLWKEGIAERVSIGTYEINLFLP
ncbi:MAG: hypothetical protein QMD43_01870 [Thermodesulfovibrio sp.]|uniref:hypothetical protein n=2 Tax=unclassified Thermodesulfovibrio TaxID=2645936 RepID=UPI00083A6A04|nr:hypothetical protein [Thermodesulfovibrio sp. N1]MDI1472075.1 hypothetical protein [Thermodesulfovibrio sp. 1176]MDI6713763.1 hypothetical protein [Thermodesulfovibrio sp.]ODA45167.1 hypothetical protein THER_0042 [Thermodesulfovibrio sp. N1]